MECDIRMVARSVKPVLGKSRWHAGRRLCSNCYRIARFKGCLALFPIRPRWLK